MSAALHIKFPLEPVVRCTRFVFLDRDTRSQFYNGSYVGRAADLGHASHKMEHGWNWDGTVTCSDDAIAPGTL